jgi:pyrrolysine biosynthesis protein PylC
VRLLVLGGRLQGTEAVYLAGKAGYETILVDRAPAPPAAGLADRHVVADIMADEASSRSLARTCDAILPACEDATTLEWLVERAPSWGVPVLFDIAAWRITRSKRASRRLFEQLNVPRPASWPACGYPVVVKPDGASGSEGVTVAADPAALRAARAALAAAGHEIVMEEYLSGPSLSLEVLGWNGRALPLQVTGLEFDSVHDCQRVAAPVGEAVAGGPAAAGPASQKGSAGTWDWERAVGPGVLARFAEVSVRLAEGLGLNGIMDVEVVVGDSLEPQVLEIDARLPSQTPTVVYWSCGSNLVELLVETARRGGLPEVHPSARRACVYQHVAARDGRLEVVGEHALAQARPLRRLPGLFGADEVLTDREPGAGTWVATLVTTADDVAEARARGARAIRGLAQADGLEVRLESDRGAR